MRKVRGNQSLGARLLNISRGSLIAKMKEYAAKRPAGAWIVGQGTYNQVMPTRAELDAVLREWMKKVGEA